MSELRFRVSAADQALLDGLIVPADLSTPLAVARWFWTLWLCRPVFVSRPAVGAGAELLPNGPETLISLLDRGMITSVQVEVFGDLLEAAVARELSSPGYVTLSMGPLPLQRVIDGLGLSRDQVEPVLGNVVMWVHGSGRVRFRAGGWRSRTRTLWPEHLAALDLRWEEAADRAAAWTDASLGARHGQEWEWRGTHCLLALSLYVLSHKNDLSPGRVSAVQVAELLADDGLERIGRPLLTELGHPLTRSIDDMPSMTWYWLTRTWPEVEEPSPVYRWSLLSRRPDTPEVDTPAWTVCADWAITAARHAG